MAPNFRFYFTMSGFSTTALLPVLFMLCKKQMNRIIITRYHLCAQSYNAKEDLAYQLGCMLSK